MSEYLGLLKSVELIELKSSFLLIGSTLEDDGQTSLLSLVGEDRERGKRGGFEGSGRKADRCFANGDDMKKQRYRCIRIFKQEKQEKLVTEEAGWFDCTTIREYFGRIRMEEIGKCLDQGTKQSVSSFNADGFAVPSGSVDSGDAGSGNGSAGGSSSSSASASASASADAKPVSLCKSYGIVGLVRFLDCYYITFIKRRVKAGCIGGEDIWSIKATDTIGLRGCVKGEIVKQAEEGEEGKRKEGGLLSQMWTMGKRSMGLGLTQREIAELRYQGLFQFIDLTKNFLFSYTYDLTSSLQYNMLSMHSKPFPPPPFNSMYAWNYSQTRPVEEAAGSLYCCYWVLPLVHGAFLQRKVEAGGRSMNLMLIARRSRFFAGTRYLKRGVSDCGKVANDVEHEQIIHDDSLATKQGVYSSYLQMRGSIPTYWTQESSVTMPKPPIVLNRVDPMYKATQAHFADLMERYGGPIVVLDLVKQSEKREREVIVGNEFRQVSLRRDSTFPPSASSPQRKVHSGQKARGRNLIVEALLS